MPIFIVKVPDRFPVSAPELGIVVGDRDEQLTGYGASTGWVATLLHSTIDAVDPGVNPPPLTLMTSPAASPLHTGPIELVVLSHVAPDALVVRERVRAEVAPEEDKLGGSTAMRTPPTMRNRRPNTKTRRPSRESRKRELVASMMHTLSHRRQHRMIERKVQSRPGASLPSGLEVDTTIVVCHS